MFFEDLAVINENLFATVNYITKAKAEEEIKEPDLKFETENSVWDNSDLGSPATIDERQASLTMSRMAAK